MTPGDVTPVDMVGMPLIMEMVSIRGRIVHHSTCYRVRDMKSVFVSHALRTAKTYDR